ncbi:MAG: hypothetical protein F9K24_02560 [Leptonema illini]|jgi:hypothetical protein|uniref:Uncharacterized protein n=2 Tax=Leptonema illini TaxID=183 RepID=H2CCA4_9LEPT|nr:hypothetical protein [Leptonema illini]EHQ06361.1 hypothetical protein Lepil_1677 [Leptonema illini DSM 21528]KAB2934680.1 MAG: hypothetical protein F9K24_02560 [Leptonema illini]PKL31178.1 MAG: hypothetical protein CVV45_15500 [Spirochaetae bacterium HGW-Spirochaetae-10]
MVQAPTAEELLERLKGFLEVHTKSRILKSDVPTMLMYIRACHANQNKKPKDQTINFLLLRFREQVLDQAPDERQRIIGDFLIDEMNKFYN